jgi:hypothetical protein
VQRFSSIFFHLLQLFPRLVILPLQIYLATLDIA